MNGELLFSLSIFCSGLRRVILGLHIIEVLVIRRAELVDASPRFQIEILGLFVLLILVLGDVVRRDPLVQILFAAFDDELALLVY